MSGWRNGGDRRFIPPLHTASWLNQVEIWFNIFTRDVVKDGVWRSKQMLIKKIVKYIKQYNEDRAHPFRWTYEGKPLQA